MIDKLSLQASHIQGQVQAFISRDLPAQAFQQFEPLGREGAKYIFVRITGVGGLYFKCFKPAFYSRRDRLSHNQLIRLLVAEVVLNPSTYPIFQDFRQNIEPLLTPEIYASGLPTARVDYAVDRPVPMQMAVQGVYWPNRRRFEDYNLESATTSREYIIGANPHSLAIYDLAAKLLRRGEPCPQDPLTRFEMRLFREMVPATISRFYSFDQIALHAGEILAGTVRPFQDIELHELRIPDMPEHYEPPMGEMVTRWSAPRYRLAQKRRETWKEIRGMMRFGNYPELRRILNVPNGRYQRYWLEMQDTVIILEQHLINSLSAYFDVNEINQLQPLHNRPWNLAA